MAKKNNIKTRILYIKGKDEGLFFCQPLYICSRKSKFTILKEYKKANPNKTDLHIFEDIPMLTKNK